MAPLCPNQTRGEQMVPLIDLKDVYKRQINRILGPSSVGKYGTVLGLVVMLKGLSSTMSGMVTPLAVASYATRDFDSLTRNISRASKFVSMGMSLPLGALRCV